MNIGIVGNGYVGSAVADGFKNISNIRIYDVNQDRSRNSLKDTIINSDYIFLTVPTPTDEDGYQDLSIILSVAREIGGILESKDEYCVIIVKSTVLPFSTRDAIIPTLETFSGRKCGLDFGICMNPEFLTEISSSWTKEEEFKRDFNSEEKIVIGEYDNKSGDMLKELYKSFNKKIYRVNLETAEMIKYASNCCLASRISFWNEIFLVCQELEGIDSHQVADIVSTDKRIGKYGSINGMAAGGTCIPKDSKAFLTWISNYRKPKMIKSTVEINDEVAQRYGVRN